MIAEIVNLANLTKSLVATIKELKDLLPESVDKERIQKKIEEAERELALAEATTAKDLGYDLCKCTFPPQIMLFTGNREEFECKSCGRKVNKSAVYTTSGFKRSDFFK